MRRLRGERANHTLQPTALVREAYSRLVESHLRFENRAHFTLAAKTMRRVLVDYACVTNRRRGVAAKRNVTLTERAALDPPAFDLLALDEALGRPTEIDEQKAEVGPHGASTRRAERGG